MTTYNDHMKQYTVDLSAVGDNALVAISSATFCAIKRKSL